MKGVILAGGTGSRLLPLTKVTNKHLLPVDDRPMIFYPLEKLIEAGSQEIMVVSGRGHAGHFLEFLGSGSSFGVRLTYEYPGCGRRDCPGPRPGPPRAGDDAVAVILGDNIFEDSFRDDIQDFSSGGTIFLKEVPDANRFGVAEVAGDRVVGIEEKPTRAEVEPGRDRALPLRQPRLRDYPDPEPSGRGELEITDVNNAYIGLGEMQFRSCRASGPMPGPSTPRSGPGHGRATPEGPAGRALTVARIGIVGTGYIAKGICSRSAARTTSR